MAHVVNQVDGEDLVAYVRKVEGGTVKLHSGDTIPAEAEEAHVALLVERGVLSEKPEPSESVATPPAPGGRKSKD